MFPFVSKLKPDQYVQHLTQVDFASLRQRGIRYYVIDVDNTLRPIKARHDGEEFDLASVRLLKELLANGTIADLCLVSNVVIKSAEREARIHRLAKLLGTEHVVLCTGRQCKPNPWGFYEALGKMGAVLGGLCTAVIGDQLFTDVAGARATGLYTIWVRPLTADKWYTAWKRLPEWLILSFFWNKMELDSHLTAFRQAARHLRAEGYAEVHGYQLAKAAESLRTGVSNPKSIIPFGMLFRVCREMEQRGYFTSRLESPEEYEGRPQRRLYRLTS